MKHSAAAKRGSLSRDLLLFRHLIHSFVRPWFDVQDDPSVLLAKRVARGPSSPEIKEKNVSPEVSHPSPDRAQRYLTSVISFMFVLSMCYRGGRNCNFSHKDSSYNV